VDKADNIYSRLYYREEDSGISNEPKNFNPSLAFGNVNIRNYPFTCTGLVAGRH
jgi:hypothetical protein